VKVSTNSEKNICSVLKNIFYLKKLFAFQSYVCVCGGGPRGRGIVLDLRYILLEILVDKKSSP
jgi:hypothetical protein